MEPSPSAAASSTAAVGVPGRLRLLIGSGVVAVYVAAIAVLVATSTSRIRHSADHDRTITVWTVWIPVVAALAVARMVPPHLPQRSHPRPAARPRRDAAVCVALAAAFALALPALGTPPSDGWYVALKIGVFAVAPTLVLADRSWCTAIPERRALGPWWWIGPAAASATWLGLAWLGPFARPSTGEATVGLLVAGFVLNAYLEERFYRGWLQSRLELVTGRWPAIGATSLLWAVWHVSLQGTGRPLVDLATVVAHQGVLGLLLGYLWARFRNPWPLLVVHGAVNAPVDLLATL